MAAVRTYARRNTTALVAMFLLGAITASMIMSRADAEGIPADKVSVSASTLEVMHAQPVPGQSEETVTLMTGRFRSSSPTDLIISVTAECALWTNIATAGNDTSQAISRVEVWVEIDGAIVPVSASEPAGSTSAIDPADQGSRGRVVFCNRASQLITENFNDDSSDDIIRSYNRTRDANGFNWGALNVGSGVHDIVVKARLATALSGDGNPDGQLAKAAVGKRTLIVEPTKMANDAVF